ncbi:Fc.00g037510.m01.CDS01 [Cosmosporella sp. VM-42]
MDDLSMAANFPMGLRDHSRSPPRQAYQTDPRGRDSRYRDDNMYDERGYDGRHGPHDEDYSGRGGHSRVGRYYPRDDHDYGGMYDEGQQAEDDAGRDRFEDERYRGSNPRYQDADNPKSQSPSGAYNRSRSHSPTREAGKPSDTVILEGLPFSVSSSELRDSILSNTIAAEFPSIDVRVSSSKGHRRAFVQFLEVDQAVAFMKENFPKLLVYMTQPTDDVPDGKFDAYIHYARSRESREEVDARAPSGVNWTCPTCDFSNYSTRVKCKICGGPQTAFNWQQSLTGVTDAANVPSQILVVYPLAPFVTEEMFTNDIKRLELEKPNISKGNSTGPKLKSTAPNGNTAGYGARPGSLHRTFLMRDTGNNESFKYGFAEFWTLEDAAAAMAKFQMARIFNVAACPVTVSTIHMGVFVPEDRGVTPAIERMSFHPLFNPSLRVRYRDLHVYPSQIIVSSQPPGVENAAKTASDEGGEGKKSKKRKAEGNLPAGSTKKSVPMAGQLAVWQKKHHELRVAGQGPGNDEVSQVATADDQSRPPVRISLSGNGTSTDASKPANQGPIKISISSTTKLGAPQAATDSNAVQETQLPTQTALDAVVSYVDRDRLMCLICMRKYKSVDEVNIHERSRNHKNATENEDQVKAALPRLAIRDKRLRKQAEENPDTVPSASQYRDRAKERRQAYNQPTKVSQPVKPKATPKPEETAPAPAKAAASKGAGMLAKMGWTTGAGLGAKGDGRTEVIATNAYVEGVGLGAEGGNLGDAAQLAERKTKNSYAEYVNTVQDKARERYNKLG